MHPQPFDIVASTKFMLEEPSHQKKKNPQYFKWVYDSVLSCPQLFLDWTDKDRTVLGLII